MTTENNSSERPGNRGDAPARIILVPSSAAGTRLDAFLSAELADQGLSRGAVKNAVKAGLCLVDGTAWTKPSRKLSGGESVALELAPPEKKVVPEPGGIDAVYEDERMAVLNKPAGLTVHPAPGLPAGTLVHRLAARYPTLAAMDGPRPGIVHRIDKDTSGLIAVALDEAARLKLSAAFAERKVDKAYLALVHGVPDPPQGLIEAAIGRDPRTKTRMAVLERSGREAKSGYEVLWAAPGGTASLVRVAIFTGRTHQIRVHMTHIGHPLVGDATYGGCHPDLMARTGIPRALAARQMLHAWQLALDHPGHGGRIEFLCPPPLDFRRLPLIMAAPRTRLVVTGLPGCGKSALSEAFGRLGAPVFSADDEVARLYAPGGDALDWMRGRYGDRFVADGPHGPQVDKPALFAALKSAPGLRREIEDMVHPMVAHRLDEFWKANSRSRLAVAEVPLFLEAGWRGAGRKDAGRKSGGTAPVVACVACPRELRLARLAASRGWDAETLAVMESWQWSEKDKARASDHVIDNSGTPADLEAAAAALAGDLRQSRRAGVRTLAAHLDGLWAPGGEA